MEWLYFSPLLFQCGSRTRVCSLFYYFHYLYGSYYQNVQKRIKNLKNKIPSDILSFVDDSLLISQEKSYNLFLFFSVATM